MLQGQLHSSTTRWRLTLLGRRLDERTLMGKVEICHMSLIFSLQSRAHRTSLAPKGIQVGLVVRDVDSGTWSSQHVRDSLPIDFAYH